MSLAKWLQIDMGHTYTRRHVHYLHGHVYVLYGIYEAHTITYICIE